MYRKPQESFFFNLFKKVLFSFHLLFFFCIQFFLVCHTNSRVEGVVRVPYDSELHWKYSIKFYFKNVTKKKIRKLKSYYSRYNLNFCKTRKTWIWKQFILKIHFVSWHLPTGPHSHRLITRIPSICKIFDPHSLSRIHEKKSWYTTVLEKNWHFYKNKKILVKTSQIHFWTFLDCFVFWIFCT